MSPRVQRSWKRTLGAGSSSISSSFLVKAGELARRGSAKRTAFSLKPASWASKAFSMSVGSSGCPPRQSTVRRDGSGLPLSRARCSLFKKLDHRCQGVTSWRTRSTQQHADGPVQRRHPNVRIAELVALDDLLAFVRTTHLKQFLGVGSEWGLIRVRQNAGRFWRALIVTSD